MFRGLDAGGRESRQAASLEEGHRGVRDALQSVVSGERTQGVHGAAGGRDRPRHRRDVAARLDVYFMLLSHRRRRSDSLSIWLILSEFMDLNYGSVLKEYLLNRVYLMRIHRFEPSEVQFEDALVSSAFVWFRNRAPVPGSAPEGLPAGSSRRWLGCAAP